MNKYHTSAVFYVPPKMTKFEVKEYLTKIYNVSVKRVRTANFLGLTIFTARVFICFILCSGKWQRFYGKRRVISYKRRDFKKAYVLLEKPENL